MSYLEQEAAAWNAFSRRLGSGKLILRMPGEVKTICGGLITVL